MISKKIRDGIERATVKLPGKSGCGVLVAGSMVLTVAHCLDYSCDGRMAGAIEPCLHVVETRQGDRFRLDTWAVEPVSDIGLLGEPDAQQPSLASDVEAFFRFRDNVDPIFICTDVFDQGDSFPVYVFTNEGAWVEGRAKKVAPGSFSLYIQFEDDVPGGTSGSPIVNGDGEIVAVVSVLGVSADHGKPNGPQPQPGLCLPVWAANAIAFYQTPEPIEEPVNEILAHRLRIGSF